MGYLNLKNDIFLAMEQKLGMVKAILAAKMCDAFKALLENRYLYQNIKIDEIECKKGLEKYLEDARSLARFQQEINSFRDSSLGFGFELEQGDGCVISHKVHPPMTVNTGCEHCKSETPHNPLRYQVFGGVKTNSGFDETIVLELQCQKCKQGNLVVQVRRTGMKLQLVGRSQIDAYTPSFDFPYITNGKWVLKLFSEAMMAERTGSHLAAVCLLRVAIEQYMRSVSGISGLRVNGDELYDAFNQRLPSDFPRDRVVSLNAVYGRLSEIMHNPQTYKDNDFLSLYGDASCFFEFVRLMPPKEK